MKLPKSRKAELAANATGGEKPHAETAESAEFKMTELGPIPVDWEVKRLDEVCSITTGHKDVNQGCKNGKYPFFTCSRNVFAANSYSFDCEAILVAGNGDVGNLHYCKGKFEAYQRTYVLKDFSEEVSYIFHELTYHLMRSLSDGKIGSSIPYITIQQLEGFMLPLPSLPEQRRIARALSDVDELISALGKLIEKKHNIKTGVMQELLTGKTRLPGFGANSLRSNHSHAEAQRGRGIEFKQTELGPIPMDWEVKRIAQCGDVITGSTPPRDISGLWGGNFNWISAKDFTGKYIVSSEERVTEAGKGYCRVLPANSVLVTCIASIGLNAIAKQPCATNQQINAVVCRECDYEYFYYQCCFNESRLRQMAGQTAVPIIGKGQFEEFPLALPKDIEEQKAIAAVLSDMDAELAALEAKLAKYESIKQGMMQELLTGRTRLKGE